MITHIVSDWLFSPCCVEHQDEFIFERVAVAYSRDYNEVGRAQIKPTFCICENKDADQLRGDREADKHLCFRYIGGTIPLLSKSKISSLYPSSVAVQPGMCLTRSETRMLVFS